MNIRTIVKRVIPRRAFAAVEPLGHLGEAVLLNTINGFPAKGLKVIGVTGTNGKTTTSFLIHRMLHEAGYKVGMMTTVAYGAGLDIRPQMTHMTTASVPVMMKRIKELKAKGVEWLVLETTSHALAQHRVWGVPYSIAVMTNLTHEHLAYHGTFDKYVNAKRLMFKQTNANHAGMRLGIINADDPSAAKFASDIDNSITYGVEGGNVRAHDIKLSPDGVQYKAELDGTTYDIKTSLAGSFNVYNTLAAVGVGHALGLSKQQIEQGIAALDSVEGRMTNIEEGQDFGLIVDYAHSPDSFEKLFKDLRPVVKGKLIVLFGSLGGGDVPKRSLQGKLAGTYADEVIVTEEDNRHEDPNVIFGQIADGAEQAGKVMDKNVFIVPDRLEAIRFALGRAKKGDTVLLLGKGHEKTIERATETIKWNEIATARKLVKAKLAKK